MANPSPKSVYVLSGTGITSSYQASDPVNVGRASRVRFWLKSVLDAASSVTTVTIKLQQRYNDGTITTAYIDLPSHLDDVAGSAQPKGSTYEIEHAYTLTAGQTQAFDFVLKDPGALLDMTINMKANVTGHSGDSLTVLMNAE